MKVRFGASSSVYATERVSHARSRVVDMAETLTSGAGVPTGLTTIVTSAVEDSAVSLAVRRKTYVPAVENVAVVLSALAFANVTVPGPLNLDQVVRRMPFGKPSSVAVPERLASAVLSSGG